MVRKITPTASGWRKRLGIFDLATTARQASTSQRLAAASWNSAAWADGLVRQLIDRLPKERRLQPSLERAVHAAIANIVQLETAALRNTTTNPSALLEAVHHRAHQRALAAFTENADQLLQEWTDALTHTFRLVLIAAPKHSDTLATFTVPFADLIPNAVDVVTQIVTELLRFADDGASALRPGSVLAARVQQAMLDLSNLTDEAARKNPQRLVSPNQSGLIGSKLVTAFLGTTPFAQLLQTPLPFDLTARFSHHHIVATPGAGKTNLIGVLLAKDFDEVAKGKASVIVLDSQGDLIKSIVRIKDFAPGGRLHERLVYIDPTDIEYPLQLNFFARRADRSLTPLKKRTEHSDLVDLLLFLFGALKQEATGRQETLIKAVASLIQEIPDATLMTLNAIFEPVEKKKPALAKFDAYLARLDPAMRDFFAIDFVSSEFSQTRSQMRARVQSLITDPVFLAMFGATTQKLDFAHEMNAGKVILINAYKDLLKTGTEVFGRFFIALAAQAAQARQNISEAQRMPTYCYIDECYEFIKADTNVETILDTGRKYRLGTILAHQRLGQLSEALKSAVSSAAIKMVRAPIYDDTRILANQLNTEPAYFDALPKHAFATRITGMTRPIALTMPLSPLATAEHMSDAEFAQVRTVMRRKYARADSTLQNERDVDRPVIAPITIPPQLANEISPPDTGEPRSPRSPRDQPRNLRDPTAPLIKPGKKW